MGRVWIILINFLTPFVKAVYETQAPTLIPRQTSDMSSKNIILLRYYRKSKAQLPGRLAELCFTPGKVAFLLCQRL